MFLQGPCRRAGCVGSLKKEILADKKDTPMLMGLGNIQAELSNGQIRGLCSSAPPHTERQCCDQETRLQLHPGGIPGLLSLQRL